MSDLKQHSVLRSEESVIKISFLTDDKPLLIPISVSYTAEDLCIAAAQHCQIGPVCRHLFALQSSDGSYLSPCNIFNPHELKANTKYIFRLRFKLHKVSQLRHLDKYAFNYCFYQMRADFLNGNISEILKLKDSALGLAVADMLRTMLEQNMSIDAVQKDYRSFLPKEINKNYKFGIKKPIQKALVEARTNCKEDAMFVKEQYMQQLYDLVPDYGCEKLQKRGKNKIGTYIFRQSSQNYDEYKIDVCCNQDSLPDTFILCQDNTGEYIIMGIDETFPTVGTLLNFFQHSPLKNEVCLKECLPPSEYDQTNLLLCQSQDKDYHQLKTMAGDCKCNSKCIPQSAILRSLLPEDIHAGKTTVVSKACMQLNSGKKKEVTIKSLLSSSNIKLQEFLNLANTILFWQCDSIMSTLGIILANPLTLVTEYFPLGPLDKYLQVNKTDIQEVDLVEAATYLAKALWYLEECGICHGKLRCKNMIVSSHEENSFKVKLGLPGLSGYTDNDIHWIPREYHHDFNLAKSSLTTDVWSFGTTVWEIFSYGEKPPLKDINEVMGNYKQGITLPKPQGCHENVDKLMKECWVKDPDERKRPQAIMRDINQTLYEVYNSRRSHSYTSISPRINSTPPVSPQKTNSVPPELPPKPAVALPSRQNRSTLFRSAFDKFIPHNPEESFDLISNNATISTLTSSQCDSSSPSTVTFLSVSEINESNGTTKVPVGSLISLSDSTGQCDQQENTHKNLQCLPSVNSVMNMDQSIWLIESHQLVLGPRLGQGFYGEVCKATLTRWSGLGKETVAVKSLKKSNFSMSGFLDLQREISIMKSLQHKNIVEIKGVVEEPELLLVMEYVPLGSLLVYIKTYKEKLDRLQLLKFASDVAEGMEYLGNKNVVHRDLAARNILVSPKNIVKISDFGLAQVTGNPGHNPYYWLKTNRDLPIRWYALESVKYGKFSTKSDVWSFGVTLWEMFSYGEEPIIPGVKDDDLLFNLEKGVRLGCPGTCPVDIYHFMLSCWQTDSHSRPTFTDIREQITELKEKS